MMTRGSDHHLRFFLFTVLLFLSLVRFTLLLLLTQIVYTSGCTFVYQIINNNHNEYKYRFQNVFAQLCGKASTRLQNKYINWHGERRAAS